MRYSSYVLPAKGSAPLAILATQFSRRVEVEEDGAAAAQGIVLFRKNDGSANGFTTAFTYPVGFEPVILGEKNKNNRGGWLGIPAQTVAGPNDQNNNATTINSAATTLFKATSASATPTTIIVAEYD